MAGLFSTLGSSSCSCIKYGCLRSGCMGNAASSSTRRQYCNKPIAFSKFNIDRYCLTFEVSLQGGVWRWLLLVVGLGIIMMIPSYPDILYFRTDLMVQSQIALVGATLLMIVALWYWRNWRWMKIVQGIVAALVGYGALRALLLIRPAVGILYGTIPEIGLGWYLSLIHI